MRILPLLLLGLSLGSAPASLVSQAALPTAPGGLRAWPLTPTSIALQWQDPATAADSCEIERRSGPEAAWETIASGLPVDTLAYTDTELDPDTAYLYRVLARNADGTAASDPARAITDDRPFGERSLSFQNGMGAYAGTYDIGIMQLQPNASSTTSYVWIDNNLPTGSDESQALVKFAGIFGSEPDRVPAGAKISQAILRVWLGTDASVESNRSITFHQMLVPWDAGHSWSSPVWGGNGVQADDVEARAEWDFMQTLGTPGLYYDLDVTPTVRAWVAGAGQYGWLIRTSWTDGYGYYTSHNDVIELRPELIVRFDNDPANHHPQLAAVHGPAHDARDVGVGAVPTLDIEVGDPDGDLLEVVLHGRRAPVSDEPDFKVVLLPDTQFYSAEINGGSRHIFFAQTEWIVANHRAENIAFALHLGDIVQSREVKSGQPNSLEWSIAAQALYRMHRPADTGLPEGFPYGVNVGNHDQASSHPDGATTFFNQYFGVAHWSKFSYYGGNYQGYADGRVDNDNHYYLFTAGAYRFIVISLECRLTTVDADILEWADSLLKAHPDHRGIVVSHYLCHPGFPSRFGPYGEAIYETLKDNPNLHFMFGGHITGEGLRTDTYQGNTVHSMVFDYQAFPFGGSGYLKVLTFQPRLNEVSFHTYSPWLDEMLVDGGFVFTLPYDLGTPVAPFAELTRQTGVAAGTRVQYPWAGLDAATEYEWLVELSDGRKTTASDVFAFRTGARTYESWRRLYFADADPAGEAAADPDADGYSNLLEFVFAGDPTRAGHLRIELPVLDLDSGVTTVAYERLRGAGLAWEYQVSTDLTTWTSAATAQVVVVEQVTDNGDGTETVGLTIDNPAGSFFWRVAARLPLPD
jgi:hypothetical protein